MLTCLTAQTQEKSLYPKLLSLLRPYSPPSSANILGWHAEGPYLQLAKRGAHAPPFLLTAPEGYKSIEKLYGAHNLADGEDWLMDQGLGEGEGVVGVRMLTAAPEVEGVMESISELTKRGIVFSIGHRSVESTLTFRRKTLTRLRTLQHSDNRYCHNCSPKWGKAHNPSLQCNAPAPPP